MFEFSSCFCLWYRICVYVCLTCFNWMCDEDAFAILSGERRARNLSDWLTHWHMRLWLWLFLSLAPRENQNQATLTFSPGFLCEFAIWSICLWLLLFLHWPLQCNWLFYFPRLSVKGTLRTKHASIHLRNIAHSRYSAAEAKKERERERERAKRTNGEKKSLCHARYRIQWTRERPLVRVYVCNDHLVHLQEQENPFCVLDHLTPSFSLFLSPFAFIQCILSIALSSSESPCLHVSLKLLVNWSKGQGTTRHSCMLYAVCCMVFDVRCSAFGVGCTMHAASCICDPGWRRMRDARWCRCQ